MKARDILSRKGSHVISVSPQSSVLDALKVMAEKNVAGVLVMEGEKLVGIFTERDYARKIILKGKTSAESKISEVMVSNLITITPDNDISDCMRLMTNKTIRHLPVVENGKLVGLISIGDVVRTIIEEQQDVIGHLEQYIAGA
ncbi:MAG TPA: CBS domain-containing protein [Chitinophagales bacterium]|nr:CBS domain-containing protein [Chitinophagales bacterium]